VSLQFANPWALLLLGCLIPVVLWARRSIAGLGGPRGVAALAVRVLIVLLVVLALARMQWSFTQDDMSVIYVLDRSLSIPSGFQKQALAYVIESQKARRSRDTAGLIVFGRSAALEGPADTGDLFDLPETRTAGPDASPAEQVSLQSVISPERTNIAAALRLAYGAFPRSGRKRIVLITDANENLGSAVEEAETARRNGIRIDVLPIRYRHDREVMVEKVVMPSNVDRGESFEVRTVIRSLTAHPARLRLYENDRLIGSEVVELKEGRNVFTVQRKLPEAGYHTITATVESPEDTLYQNNTGSAFTMVRGRGRVLYIEGDMDHAGDLYDALVSQGLEVTLVGLDALPMPLGELLPNDTVILSNVPAANLGRDGMQALELAVKNWGVGLVMIGGENSYGPGGYQNTPVEKALPVTMDIKSRRVMPSGALVVILHTCEIPEGNYWAQQVAMAALNALSPTDEYGVVYYDWQSQESWLFPLQRVENRTMMQSRIVNCQPGDMPSFITSMNMAHTALKASTASIKHVIIISDGDPEYPNDTAVNAMVADGITISTVGISPHSPNDTVRLAHVANLGGGNYYEPQSASVLPEIFIREAATVRRALIFEEPFTPTVAMPSQLTTGVSPGEYPVLGGYVCTTAKELAEVPLVTHHDDPLLAHHQYGLGRTVAFTSDAKTRWAGEWVGWGKYAQFWAQVVRWSSRNISSARLQVRSEIRDDRAHIVLDAVDAQGRFINGLRFQGAMVTPENEEVPLRLAQTGPGRYEAEFDVHGAGTHYVSLAYTDEQGRPALYTGGLVVPYSAEYRELGANEGMLVALAEMTGGRLLGLNDDPFARTFPPASRSRDAWPYLLLVAVLLVPADVFLRRVFVDWSAAWARLAALVRRIPVLEAARPVARPTHVSALLSRKRETRDELAKRARKFEPAAGVELREPMATTDGEAEGPRVTVAARPTVHELSRPAVLREDETYMGRLLAAKRRAKKEAEERGEEEPSSTDGEG